MLLSDNQTQACPILKAKKNKWHSCHIKFPTPCGHPLEGFSWQELQKLNYTPVECESLLLYSGIQSYFNQITPVGAWNMHSL